MRRCNAASGLIAFGAPSFGGSAAHERAEENALAASAAPAPVMRPRRVKR
jgi:hypothetical protein